MIERSTGDIIAEIKMSMTSFKGAYVLVEGPTDSQFFKHHLDDTHCQVIICGAKMVVIDSVNGINAIVGVDVLGVIDDDFDRALGIKYKCVDLISTETHDIETMLLSSAAWDKVIAECADHSKVREIEVIEKMPLKECLLSRATPFGQLRLISAQHELNVDFKKYFSPWKYISDTDWRFDRTNLMLTFTEVAGVTDADLDEYLRKLPIIPVWDLVQGHDIVAILAIGFRSGVFGKNQLSEKVIMKDFRLAYGSEMFCASLLSANIAIWEKKSGIDLRKCPLPIHAHIAH